jgi:hypothetical protein
VTRNEAERAELSAREEADVPQIAPPRGERDRAEGAEGSVDLGGPGLTVPFPAVRWPCSSADGRRVRERRPPVVERGAGHEQEARNCAGSCGADGSS